MRGLFKVTRGFAQAAEAIKTANVASQTNTQSLRTATVSSKPYHYPSRIFG
jgi:hypothetical protein